MTTTQQPEKKCPHCNHKLVGTEIFRDTCPRCRRPLKETATAQAPQAAPATKPPVNRAPEPVSQVVHDSTERINRHPQQPPVVPPVMVPPPMAQVAGGNIYKIGFFCSLGLNGILIITLLLIGLKLTATEPLTPTGTTTDRLTTENGSATTAGETALAAPEMAEEPVLADNTELPLSAIEKTNTRSNRRTGKNTTAQAQIIIPPKIEAPTPNPRQDVDQTGAGGSLMISSQPPADVVLGGKKVGRTPGLKTTLPSHTGILLVGDNSTPFNMRFVYQEEEGHLVYQISSHPACQLLLNGKIIGRTPQEVTSRGGIDNFQCELPNTDTKMKVILKYSAQ